MSIEAKADSAALMSAASSGAVALHRQATDIAHVCRDMVTKTAVEISGRKYVRVEGWMSIAVAHGCIASVKSVEDVPSGVRAVAEVRRQLDGAVLTSAEGFVGKDEVVWYGGRGKKWNKAKRMEEEVEFPKRAEYAIRAMAQTRAVSRACRTAFAHVVVLMNAGLSTMPAEELSADEDDREMHSDEASQSSASDPKPMSEAVKSAVADAAGEAARPAAPQPEVPRDEILALRDQFRGGKWETVSIHFGKNKDVLLRGLEKRQLRWYIDEWQPRPYQGRISEDDKLLRAALDVAAEELKD